MPTQSLPKKPVSLRSRASLAARVGLLGVASLTFLACGNGITVNTAYDHGVELGKYRKFAMQLPNKAVQVPGNVDPFVMLKLRQMVHARLVARGYEVVEKERAEFLVAVNAGVEQKVDTYGDPSMFRPAMGDPVDTYTEGTLTIEFLTPTESVVVWRGVAESRVTKETSDERLGEVADAILARFPPDPAAASGKQK